MPDCSAFLLGTFPAECGLLSSRVPFLHKTLPLSGVLILRSICVLKLETETLTARLLARQIYLSLRPPKATQQFSAAHYKGWDWRSKASVSPSNAAC
jgi:hypothetical protein